MVGLGLHLVMFPCCARDVSGTFPLYHVFMLQHFFLILIYGTYYSTAMWQIPKKESHMAYMLYVTQLKQLKLVAGKFCHLFCGQLFFR